MLAGSQSFLLVQFYYRLLSIAGRGCYWLLDVVWNINTGTWWPAALMSLLLLFYHTLHAGSAIGFGFLTNVLPYICWANTNRKRRQKREPSVESINSLGLLPHLTSVLKERMNEKRETIKRKGKINEREGRRNNQLLQFPVWKRRARYKKEEDEIRKKIKMMMTLFIAMKWRLRWSFHLATHPLFIFFAYSHLRSSEQNRIVRNLESLRNETTTTRSNNNDDAKKKVLLMSFPFFLSPPFSHARSARYTYPLCYLFSLWGEEMAAQRDAFPGTRVAL